MTTSLSFKLSLRVAGRLDRDGRLGSSVDPLRLYLPIIEVFVRLSRLAWLMACACPVHEAHLCYLLRQFDSSAISTITNIRAWNNQKSVLLF